MSISAVRRSKRWNFMLRYLEGIFGKGVVCPSRGNGICVDSGSHSREFFPFTRMRMRLLWKRILLTYNGHLRQRKVDEWP